MTLDLEYIDANGARVMLRSQDVVRIVETLDKVSFQTEMITIYSSTFGDRNLEPIRLHTAYTYEKAVNMYRVAVKKAMSPMHDGPEKPLEPVLKLVPKIIPAMPPKEGVSAAHAELKPHMEPLREEIVKPPVAPEENWDTLPPIFMKRDQRKADSLVLREGCRKCFHHGNFQVCPRCGTIQ